MLYPCSILLPFCQQILIPVPDKKNVAFPKLKAFVDDNFSVAQMVQFFFDSVENFVGKGENAGNQHFLLFQQCFHRAFFKGSLKGGIVGYRVNLMIFCDPLQ